MALDANETTVQGGLNVFSAGPVVDLVAAFSGQEKSGIGTPGHFRARQGSFSDCECHRKENYYKSFQENYLGLASYDRIGTSVA